MKDKLMALLIIALIIEVTTIVVISFLALIGAMNLTDGCMYRYPLTAGTSNADATVDTITLKANGNYTSATTVDNGTTVQATGPGPQQFADNTAGYTYGQWMKTKIQVTNGQQIKLGVSGAVSLCRAYLPINNLESTGNIAVNTGSSNSTIIRGQPIPIPRVEESTPPIKLLFDASASGGWRTLTKVGFQDELQVTIGDNPVQVMQNGVNVSTSVQSVSFPSMFSSQNNGRVTGNCSDGLTTYSPVCNRYTPYNIPGQQYITDCQGSVIQQMRYWTCSGPNYNTKNNCTDASPNGTCIVLGPAGTSRSHCCIWKDGTCRDGCKGPLGVTCHQADPTANYWQETLTSMPVPYSSAGTYTYPIPSTGTTPSLIEYGDEGFYTSTAPTLITRSDGVVLSISTVCAAKNLGDTLSSTPTQGTKLPGAASGIYLSRQWFWLASNAAIGLYERTSTSATPTYPDPTLGTKHTDVALLTGAQAIPNLIKSVGTGGVAQSDAGYLQYRFMTVGDSAGSPTFNYNSGGYVIGLKQTACRALDGKAIPSTTANTAPTPNNTSPLGFRDGNIGDVRYVILDSDIDPNYPIDPNNTIALNNISSRIGSLALTSGTGYITPQVTSSKPQNLWLKIANDPINYSDSFGQYTVSVYTEVPIGQFSSLVLNNVLVKFKSIVISAGIKVFENMTCMTCNSNDPGAACEAVEDRKGCSNFFMYINAMLTLYVMIFGMMFLLGLVKISNQDFVIRIVKIALVSGLLNGSALQFFNNYVFNFVTQFTDEMIANLSGYASNAISVENSDHVDVSNPFMFLDALMSRIFFSKTFFTQVLAMLSLGISGAFYFIIVFIALVVLIITIFRAISIYIMAFMAVALLLGLAPLFLTFMLFERSFYLFENWMRFLFRYMMEPVILMAGITILTQLFTVYLDYVLSYSVCWKCGLVFKIPFAGIPGLSMFQDLPLFCINWFTPWGLDNSGASGMMGMNLQNMVALVMIAFAMYGYTEMSGQLVGRLTNTMLAPSMTAVGNAMTSAAGQKILKQVGMDKETREQREQKSDQDAARRRASVNKLLEDQKEWGKTPKSTASQNNANKAVNPNAAQNAGQNAAQNVANQANNLNAAQNANAANGNPLDPNATKKNQPPVVMQPLPAVADNIMPLEPYKADGTLKTPEELQAEAEARAKDDVDAKAKAEAEAKAKEEAEAKAKAEAEAKAKEEAEAKAKAEADAKAKAEVEAEVAAKAKAEAEAKAKAEADARTRAAAEAKARADADARAKAEAEARAKAAAAAKDEGDLEVKAQKEEEAKEEMNPDAKAKGGGES